MVRSKGIPLKKRYGQHFLRDLQYVRAMFDAVSLTDTASVLEIGCGDGFLTREILKQPMARLWVYEIDEQWATHVRETIPDSRLRVITENFLDLDLRGLAPYKPWTVLANLPYQITFPVLHRFQKYRHLLKEGVVMIQEEVAQKIVKTSGRGYGFPSLFFQHYFTWNLLDKVPPSAFYPPPKVFSRLIYFKPIVDPVMIPDEEQFWKFIKRCFSQPRRMLSNNLRGLSYSIDRIPGDILHLRAQQMSMEDFLKVWELVRD
ncbi:ribosomal RNA small subunit methyltransferase A [Candidatus Dependentiae bacterium]|nr:MAG: ribosomal RNA small subunit methyltransferase A [Candidatus Dependentiae bacterium]